MADNRHHWRFFRAGGFDQVKLNSGADLAHLEQLDQKLWVALACPTSGLEFDKKTLDLIDSDKDGRIRVPEVIAAAKWATGLLKDPDYLAKSSPVLPLEGINDATAEGKQLLASAKQILANLGKGEEAGISVEDTADTSKIFAQTKFNGDGIVPPDAAEDPKLQAVINDVIACLGAETDRSGKAGITQAKLDLFFADAAAFAGWEEKAVATDGAIMPLGPNTPAGAAALKGVAAKVEDYFARCRLAAFDARAVSAVNLAEDQYTAVAAKTLSLAGTEMAGFPLARIEPGRPLPLTEGVNPGWQTAIDAFRVQVVKPLLGEKTTLTQTEWSTLVAKFAPFDSWLSAKAGASVEKLGLARVQEILAYTTKSGGGAKTAISDLIAKDKALEPEANAIAAVDRLVRYHRDLFKLLNNFVAFRDFYGRKDKAIFQAGTLYLDQRSCDLCIRVEDAGRHGAMAHLSYTYLAYCDLSRKATGEKMMVACAFTAGDSDNLMVGRNGVFYDRQGRDWDATITKIIDAPISIRQAFFSPYKRAIRFVSEQIAKRAAAADDAATNRLKETAVATTDALTGKPVPPPPPKPKIDIGVVAALGVAVGGITAALGALLGAFFGLGMWMPLGVIALVILISGPSMLIAALKLRQRNLGPILDANGWAVNAKAKINIPFGGSLTQTSKLPPGSQRDLVDPFAESHKGRDRTIAVVVIAAILAACWYFGCIEYFMPNVLPKSSHVKMRDEERTRMADALLKDAAENVTAGKLDLADAAVWKLEAIRKRLPEEYGLKIDSLKKSIATAKAALQKPTATKGVETAPATKP